MKWAALVLGGLLISGGTFSQARDGAMSESEVEALRETSLAPLDRIVAFEKILNGRETTISRLVVHPHRADFASSMHDAIEEFGEILDELNDNLDDYSKTMRDVRKALPGLIAATDRWTTTLRSSGDNERYKVVRRIALDTLIDTHDLSLTMQQTQSRYFKEHPDAAKEELDRVAPRVR